MPGARWCRPQTRPSRTTASTDRKFRTAFARLLMQRAAMARIGISPGGQPGHSPQGDSKQTFGPAPVNGTGKAGGRQMTTLRGRAPGFKFLTLVVGLPSALTRIDPGLLGEIDSLTSFLSALRAGWCAKSHP